MVAVRQPQQKAGRPSAVGVTRSRQIPPTSVTPDEEEFIRKAVEFIGDPITHWCRKQLIEAARRVHQSIVSGAISKHSAIQKTSAELLRKVPISSDLAIQPSLPNISEGGDELTITNEESNSYELEEPIETEAQIPEENQAHCEIPQTRARAPKDLRKEDLRDQDRSSLRSDQAAPDSETDDAPWQRPNPLKQTIQLSTGQMATNIWVFANGLRMETIDMSRIMNTPSLKHFRKALIQCWARSIREVYKLRWCAAYRRRSNAWHDTGRSNVAFMKAAEYLIAEFISRGMTTSQFIDAAQELRPKSIRFVTPDLLGGSIGSRVAAWIPPEQRDRDKGLSTHVDSSGQTWVTPDGEAPVPVLRSKADRDQFLRQHGIKV